MFWYNLRQRQIIINTFFEKDQLKPISIKLLVMVFSFTCYFVINGFLYNEDYITQVYNREGSITFIDYLQDSIERIIFSSLVGGFISFLIGIVFSTDKKIEKVIEREKKNKIVLKGKISKIYKCNNITLLLFIIFQFMVMTFFTIYVICFGYVYPNNTYDWYLSSLFVLGLVQSFSFITSFVISISKYLSVKYRWEFCFKINEFLEENI